MPQKSSIFYKSDYEKKYKRMRIAFVVVILLFAAFIYTNYNYIAFKILMSYNYAYTDTLDEMFVDSISEESFKGYFSNFDEVAIYAFTKEIREYNGDRYTYLYTPQEYKIKKEYDKEIVKEAVCLEVSPSTVYIYLPSVSKYTKDFFMENIGYISQYNNIIIDFQGNPGGTLEDMYKLANLFLEKGQIIGVERTRNAFTTKTVKAKGEKELEYDNIIILINGSTASACEGFTMALRDNLENVIVIGERSFGKGIGQITMPLRKGFAVKATVMQIETPTGSTIHGVGIEPDYEYNGEDTVGFALELIDGE